MNLSTLRAGAALLPLLFAVPAIAQQASPPAKPAEAPAAPAQPAPAQAAPQGQQAPMPKEFRIDAGGWKGGAVPNPTNKQFSHCDVSKAYDGGLTLAFTLNPNYQLNVAVVKQNWGLKEADKGKGRIRVDATYDKPFDVVPVSPVAYVLPVGQDADLMQLLAKGSKAIVTTPKGEFTFALTGTGAALGGLRDCIETARKLIAQAQGNAGGQQGQQQGGGDPRTLIGAQGFGMPVGALQDILNGAGIKDVGIADPRKLPRDPLQINQAWQVGTDGKVVGGLHQEPRGDAVEIDQFAKRYLEIMKSVCGTDWQSSDQPAAIEGPYAVKRAELSCTMNQQKIAASLVFTLDDNYYSAFFHQALQTDKALADDASGKLATFIQTQMAAVEAEKQKQESGQAAPAETPATPPADGTQPPAATPAPATPPSGN
ncbi:hypothetical protein FFK22_011495 [Mycobacterium sp. KBS0706]|uniref:hypothetical protein n=1 Tax=Mycobacterium sp. KBS0706 TaxID=2578109 RepID=UPI00110F8532|nr:hypothetical protein [Mycobacterium sp. KBS0706]TSD88672.1 hypothetical protein FFK22_011495 [Mycobacterium sp. KBS0706]